MPRSQPMPVASRGGSQDRRGTGRAAEVTRLWLRAARRGSLRKLTADKAAVSASFCHLGAFSGRVIMSPALRHHGKLRPAFKSQARHPPPPHLPALRPYHPRGSPCSSCLRAPVPAIPLRDTLFLMPAWPAPSQAWCGEALLTIYLKQQTPSFRTHSSLRFAIFSPNTDHIRYATYLCICL